MGNLSLCGKIFLVIHLILTGFFVAVGCVVLGVGIYLQVESRNFSFITGSDYASGPILLIVSGVITLIISSVGFIGGCLRWRPLLVIYAITIILIIILEIITGIVGFVFSDTTTEESEETYRNRLGDAIEQYDTNEDAERAMNYLQDILSCCGIDGPSDWARNGDVIWDNMQQLPESCRQCNSNEDDYCGPAEPFYYNYTNSNGDLVQNVRYNSTDDVWTRGCYNRTIDALIAYAIVYAGVGIAFGIVEIFGVIVALCLVCCITCGAKKDEYV